MGGRRHPAGGRDQRDLDGQPATPRVAQRRGRADHRGGPAGDRARPGGASGGPDRARGHGPRGPAPPPGPRQRLPAGAHRRRARQLLPPGQPHRTARVGPAVGGRQGRRGTPRLPRAPRHRWAVGDQGTGRGIADRGAGQRRAGAPGRTHGHAHQGRAGRGARAYRRRPGRCRLRGARAQPGPARRPRRAVCRSGRLRRRPGTGAGGPRRERHSARPRRDPPKPPVRVHPGVGHQLGHPCGRRRPGRARDRHRRLRGPGGGHHPVGGPAQPPSGPRRPSPSAPALPPLDPSPDRRRAPGRGRLPPTPPPADVHRVARRPGHRAQLLPGAGGGDRRHRRRVAGRSGRHRRLHAVQLLLRAPRPHLHDRRRPGRAGPAHVPRDRRRGQRPGRHRCPAYGRRGAGAFGRPDAGTGRRSPGLPRGQSDARPARGADGRLPAGVGRHPPPGRRRGTRLDNGRVGRPRPRRLPRGCLVDTPPDRRRCPGAAGSRPVRRGPGHPGGLCRPAGDRPRERPPPRRGGGGRLPCQGQPTPVRPARRRQPRSADAARLHQGGVLEPPFRPARVRARRNGHPATHRRRRSRPAQSAGGESPRHEPAGDRVHGGPVPPDRRR